MAVLQIAKKPLRGVGGFFAMTLDVCVLMFKPPFAWQELVTQTWFVARVSLLPAVGLSITYMMMVIFILNIPLAAIGAIDLSGAAASLNALEESGPIVTALVVGGAAATAMCADLGARTIREELDALRVLGINPVQALVVPRILATTLGAVMLSGVVMVTGMVSQFFFSVYVQHADPGAFVANLLVLVQLPHLVFGLIKVTLEGLAGGLIACYQGLSVGGGAQGVGNAVNETVVFSFMALFAIQVLVTAIKWEVMPR